MYTYKFLSKKYARNEKKYILNIEKKYWTLIKSEV